MSTKHQVVIMGAGYGALISGAILARAGLHPLIIEQTDTVGGCNAAYEMPKHPGYYTQYGHRDHYDYGDLLNIMGAVDKVGLEAVARTGAAIEYEFYDPVFISHKLPEGRTTPLTIGNLQRYLAIPDAEFALFTDAMRRSGAVDPRQVMDMTVEEWLCANVSDDRTRQLFRNYANAMYFPVEMSSMGRWAEMVRAPRIFSAPVNSEYPGLMGMLEPYADVIRAHGGEFRFEHKVIELVIEDYHVKGVVVQDKSSCTEMIECATVICTHSIWEALDISDDSQYPKGIVENARKLETWLNGDIAVREFGLKRLPTRRHDNHEEDDHVWHRVQRGDNWAYGGCWGFPSLFSKHVAPPGKHLCTIGYGSLPEMQGPFRSFKQAQDRLDTVVAYMREYYSDFDDVTEWSEDFLNRHPTIAPMQAGLPWAPMKMPSIDGLYFAGGCVEVPGGNIGLHDTEARSAIDVADMVVKRLGGKAT